MSKSNKTVITVCTVEQYKDIQGIHLHAPSERGLSDALIKAEDKGFRTVFCHQGTSGDSNYIINCDTLNYMVELHKNGFVVSFTHPQQ